MPAYISFVNGSSVGAGLSGLRSTAEGGPALTAMIRCWNSCSILCHHAPDKAGEFSCYRCFCHVAALVFSKNQIVVTASEAFVGLIRVSNDCWWISFLTFLQDPRFVSDPSVRIALGSLYKEHPNIPVSGFRDTKAVPAWPAGVFAGRQPQIRRKTLRVCEPFEIADFSDDRERRQGLDTKETGQLLHIFLIFLLCGKFFDPLIEALDLGRQVVEGDEVFLQDLAIQPASKRGSIAGGPGSNAGAFP